MRRLVAVLIVSATAWALAPAAHATLPGANGKIAFAKPGFGASGSGTPSYPDIWTMNPDGTGAVNLTQTYGYYDQSPAWSPDRTKIAFESYNGNYTQIYVMNANGSDRRPVNGTGHCEGVAWSPDGTEFAMSCDTAYATAIYLLNPDGSGRVRLTVDDYPADTAPAWSPDGTQIAWSAGGDLWKMNADGSSKSLLVDNPANTYVRDVTWSPDGTQVAFAADRDCVGCSKNDIYRVYANGTGLTRFGYTPDTVNGLVYSPDGTKILFDSCEMRDETAFCYDLALYTMNSDGTGLEPVPGNADDLGSSPDWQVAGPQFVDSPPTPGQIVFMASRDHIDLPYNGVDDSTEIYTMNPDGSRQRRLTANLFRDADPAWSADGSKVAFSSRRDGNFEIYRMNGDGTNQTRLTDHPDIDGDPTWSADGTRIAFTRFDMPTQLSRLMVMNADGSDVHPLFASPPSASDQHPDWSPTADRIAFDRNGDIYAVNPDGTGLAPLTDDIEIPYDDSYPNWAPSGEVIAFTRYQLGSGSNSQIWHMQANGTYQTQYTFVSSGGAWAPSWDPEGRFVAFNSSGGIYFNGPVGKVPLAATHPYTGIYPDWQPVFGYPRPKGATPTRISFVTAYKPCTAPNREHGSPLAFSSCNPPQRASDFLTVGTADANAKPALNEGYLLMAAIPGVPSTPADEADATLEFFSDDVFTTTLADYTGELRVSFSVRATDRNNSPSPVAGTAQDFPIAFSAPCAANPDPAEGSACTLSTTVDALIPGAIAEAKRAMWQLDQVRVFDGGADGDGDTTGDNTPFATQGVFVP